MKNVLFAIFSIVGTVIGSGFISGKEIVVFFSRFGSFSFIGIFLMFFLFFFIFLFIFNHSNQILERLYSSKFAYYINLILCLIFSSAMYAGISNIIAEFDFIFKLLIFFFVIFLNFLIYKNGLGSLGQINLFFIPFMVGFFVFNIISMIKTPVFQIKSNFNVFLSIFYAILYLLLNVSNNCVLLGKLGQSLSKKQKTRVAFYSALVLFLILLVANILLLQNQISFKQDMPILSLFNGKQKFLMLLVVFAGCSTTLFSLTYTLSFSMRGLCKNEFFIFIVSVLFPLILSLLGFGFIVSFLYPISSALGAVLVADLFFTPLFKRTYKKIHPCSKNTK